MEKSIYVQSRKLGNFYWRYNADEPDSLYAVTKYTYTSMYDLVRLNPEISFRFTILVFENDRYTNLVNSFRDWGFQCFFIPLNFQDEWTINNIKYIVRRLSDYLCIRRKTDISTSNEIQISWRPNTGYPSQLCGCYFSQATSFRKTYLYFDAHINENEIDYITIPSLTQPRTFTSGGQGTQLDILHEIFDSATPTPPTPTPPTPADKGIMYNSNSLTLNYHLLDFSMLRILRNKLWERNFLDLFSEYNNKASLIPYCMIYPVKIDPIKIRTDAITIGNNEHIYVDNYYISYNQKEGGEDKTLIAQFSLSEYPKTNSYLDYPTVTEYKLFLPFVGFINIDFQYLNKGITVYYFLDYTTGYCVCNINSGDIRINEIDIQLGQILTLAGGDNTAWKQSIWGVVGAVAGLSVMALTGNVLASTATYSGVKTISTVQQEPVVSKEIKQYHGGNQLSRKETLYKGNASQTITREEKPHTVKYTHGLTPYYLARSVNAFSDLKAMEQGITVNSSTNPNSFVNSYIHPYLLIRRPTTNIDINKFKKLEGHPLNDVRRLIDITGYTEVGNIHVDIDAYEEEISEISELLMGGVIINAH